jgi:pimeloyl-ACP methyl ester carboxylesterase
MRTFLLHGGPGLENYWPDIFDDSRLEGIEHFPFPVGDHIDDYVTALLEKIRGLDCTLVGHSFGGVVAPECLKRGQAPHVKKVTTKSHCSQARRNHRYSFEH